MPWLQFSVDVAGERADAVSEAFEVLGALSVTVLDAGDEPLLEPAPGETPLWRDVRVVALFGAGTNPDTVQADLRETFADQALTIETECLEDRDWSSTWRDSFGVMQFGKHLWVCPIGETPPDPDAVVVNMDPGLAFGTGTHATTALCLQWLDAHPPVGQQVIDYGCGSGVLALAAYKLGAVQVHAVDIDPQALLATRENAVRNGIETGIEVLLPEELGPVSVGLMIANILANPLIELAPELAGRVATGGHIILTGILAEQAEAVMAAYRPWFEFETPVSREEWVLLVGVKPGHAQQGS